MMHADSDGTWSPGEARILEVELVTIKKEFELLRASGFPAGWQADLARTLGLKPSSKAECYIDIDGELLLDRLISVAHLAHERSSTIWFQ